MASTKISALTDGVTANATDDIPAARGGANVRITPAYIRTYLLALANTWAATQTITPAVNTNALAVTGYSLTGANAQSLIDLAGTWNTSGTPTAIKFNITNTASNAASNLIDLQLSTVSMFKVDIAGSIYIGTERFVRRQSGGDIRLGNINGDLLALQGGNTITTMSTTATFSFNSDVTLNRDASDVLAQRRSTTAQEHRWYNTFTDASNYERMSLAWSSNVAIMKPQNAGTGSARLFVPVTGATVVASLPSAATMGAGARSFVTDATTPVFGAAVVGSGAVKVPVVSDGASWLVG